MRKIPLSILLLLSFACYSQSWQWGKRGGALDQLSDNFEHDQEEVYGLVTDAHKNIYGLSRVASVNLNIDGVPKTNFDNPSWYPSDFMLFSFGCDGSYRWSKVIGGEGTETVNPIQVDNQNNIYVSGNFQGCAFNSPYPHRIDSDIIIPSNPQDCRNLFLAKYNDAGVLQWIKRPQAVDVDETTSVSATASRDLQTDENGNSYWLVALPPGTYENGAFVNTMAGSNFFMLKYDAQGNYLGNIYLDIQTTGAYGFLRLYRNKYNGYFYIVSTKSSETNTAVVSGNTITGAVFVACFDNQGAYQWHRECTFTDPGYLNFYNLAFDDQNNIYFGGLMTGLNTGSFLGFSIPIAQVPGFVMKTNPTATQVLWSSYHNKRSSTKGGIVLNGNELAYTSYCFGPDFTWGTQTLNVNATGQGQEVLLARFNKDTGACISLAKISGSNGFNDVGDSIAADASGDYILGGAIGGTLYFNSGQQITNSGSQSDFFVAKYALEACSPLAVNEHSIPNPMLYPNPTKGLVTFDNSNSYFQTAFVYNYLGQEIIKTSNLTATNISIDLSGVPNGVYIIKLNGSYGSKSLKVVKE